MGTNFVVEEGESLRSISLRLQNENYIKSALLFRAWVSFLGRDRHIQLGVYSFDKPLVLGAVIKKLVSGNPDAPLVSLTIPEGSSYTDIANLIKKELPNFSIDIFNKKVLEKNANGKLFPSTYYLLPSTKEERIVDIMVETFNKKYSTSFSNSKIDAPLKNKEDVIILASILEGEAKTSVDMKMVAGILLKRLTLNMPLQVDAAKETYSKRGLPVNPINNPGIVAMDAVFNAVDSSYLYYITGKDGIMHYSKTFEEHKRKIQKYLK
ncbi:MAG: endolytic transglycosylase MltG [Candidatus Nomurabacteria bacterium]